MSEELNLYGLVNKPPIDEIFNLDLVNKPPLVTEDDELAHFGILGMKWGVRRYQNPDGTLTEAGKLRVAKMRAADAKRQERETRKKKKYIDNPDTKYFKKHLEKFTDEEVERAIKRMEWKKHIDQLNSDKISIGKNRADTIIKYGDTLNGALKFINSDAGKGIRQKLGLKTDTIFDFANKERKAEEKQKDADSFNDWKNKEWAKKVMGVNIEKFKKDQYEKWGWKWDDNDKNNKNDGSSMTDAQKAFFESEAGQSAFEEWDEEEKKKKKKK